MKETKDFLGDYDFTRSDKFYQLKIPTYQIEEGVVFYEINLRDLVNNEVYLNRLRFKEMKNIHEALQSREFELPPFPKTHFWTKTNNNPELIEKRRSALETYLSHVINDPFLRGYPEIKKIIKLCKQGNDIKRRLSSQEKVPNSPRVRSQSQKRRTMDTISRAEWKRLKRQNTLLK